MLIRWKLLILLLAIALVPLLFVGLLDRRGMLWLGRDLAASSREALTERASRQLEQLVEDQAAILRREREILELMLRVQGRAAESCLAAPPPEQARLYFADDYDRGGEAGPPVAPTGRHFRFVDGEDPTPVAVTYDEQAFKLAPGVEREAVAGHLACLSHMVESYKFLHQEHPDLVYWQFTSLDSGVHSSYPGHGGYPAKYDPRQRDWYVRAKAVGDLIWTAPYVDASSMQVIVTAALPVRGPSGEIAGVTAIDVPVNELMSRIKLPPAVSEEARRVLVSLRPVAESSGDAGAGEEDLGLLILAQPGYERRERRWETPYESEWLRADDEADTFALIREMKERRSVGVRRMSFEGTSSLWAYGLTHDKGAYLVVIVPYAEIVAMAEAAERAVLDRTWHQLRVTGGIGLAVVAVVILVAVYSSRSVTWPVLQLAAAARRIARGHFDTQVKIRTKDELGQLGQVFNAMVPQLADRMRLRQSLSLAMEVQQNLLPAKPPSVEGLDVAGKSIYCDETGGDYYDFLELAELGPHRLGVAVGDVTGHGIAAALLMTTARALLRSRAVQPGTLAQMMSDINRRLTADTPAGRFMTLFYAVIDAKERKVTWVSAGHDPAIVYSPSRDAFEQWAGEGIPLGIEPDWRFPEFTDDRFEDGQVIVIGTDGIWETRNPQGEQFGKDALRTVIRQHAGDSAEDIGHAITDALASFQHTQPQEDDRTLVVIKVLGHATT